MLNLVPSCHEKHSVGVEPFASWPSERDGGGGPFSPVSLCVFHELVLHQRMLRFFSTKNRM